jgi:uncharacterized LabA/DUF88 family protein
MIRSAILVDGGFYRRRAQFLWGEKCSKDRADELIWYCRKHLFIHGNECELYRIFYYDCPPMSKKMRHPLSGELIDFEKTDLYTWTTEFLNELRKKRKVALRLGTLAEAQAHFNIDPQVTKKLCNSTMQWGDLTKDDFKLDVKQKGVDMKIGIDIASLAYKKQVDQIVLISADSDFVPASKLARREGIDFILDPMWATIKPELHEHIDGLRSGVKNPDTINNDSVKLYTPKRSIDRYRSRTKDKKRQ